MSHAESAPAASECLGLRALYTAKGCASSAARGAGQRGAGMGAGRSAVRCVAGVGLPMSGMGCAEAAGLGVHQIQEGL